MRVVELELPDEIVIVNNAGAGRYSARDLQNVCVYFFS